MRLSNGVVHIPVEYRPAIEELPGDLRMIAQVIEEQLPGHGVQVVLILAQAFRGQTLYFRAVDYLLNRMRDDAIRAAYDQGERVIDIGLRWRLSRSAVEKILARPDTEEARQMKLF
ncbi:MAG: Mor transcription activator family protein [Desulfobulbaceae bacterium]